ncbi:hypothetical protein [Spiroplasma endosymbiont of Panorpa germanica]|uniref:hypothetical protein n=1 Tax=Spiroplasma endosymbiont of Panorpa germanica TaxID=3066314 RepID=UPI0030CFECB8
MLQNLLTEKNKEKFENGILEVVEKTIKFIVSPNHIENSRSSQKVDGIHERISQDLDFILGSDYMIRTKKTTGNEVNVKGAYVNKNVDIAIERISDKKIVAVIEVKMHLSSISKNLSNNFENLLGQSANMRSVNIPFFQVSFLNAEAPVFSLTNDLKMETINLKWVNRYLNLSFANSKDLKHVPDCTLIFAFNLLKSGGQCKNKRDYNRFIDESFLKKENSIQKYKLDQNLKFGPNVIFNEYLDFLVNVVNKIRGLKNE